MSGAIFKLLFLALLAVSILSSAEETPFTTFEEETSPQAIRRFTSLRKSGAQVPFRWKDLHEILNITPSILIHVGKMRSPLDNRLMIEAAPYMDPRSTPVDEFAAQKLLAYVSRPELYPSRLLELFFSAARESELQAADPFIRKNIAVALEIDLNITRSLNLLIHFGLQNPENKSYYLMRALLNIVELQNPSLDQVKTPLMLDGYYKLLAYQLAYASDPVEFKFALDRIAQMSPAHIFSIFNSSNMNTPGVLSERGYSNFKFKLAHILSFKLKRFESIDISTKTLFKITNPIIHELEVQAKSADLRVVQKELWKEIREICINALSMLELESHDFFSKSLSTKLNKANAAIADIETQQERESRLREIAFSRPPALEEQRARLRENMTNKLNYKSNVGTSMNLGTAEFSFDVEPQRFNTKGVRLISISYRKPHHTRKHQAHEINPFMSDYANSAFVLETILINPHHDGVLWGHQIPEEILKMKGLTITPHIKGLVILKIDPILSCKKFF